MKPYNANLCDFSAFTRNEFFKVRSNTEISIEELIYDKSYNARLQTLFSNITSNSFFLTYAWFDAWLSSLTTSPRMLFLKNREQDIGLVFFDEFSLNEAWPTLKLFDVNKSSCPDENQVWIEYNCVICDNVDRKQCIDTILAYVYRERRFIGLQLQMAESRYNWLENSYANMNFLSEVETVKAYSTLLQPQNDIKVFLQDFSSGVRNEFNRSTKKATQFYGPLNFEFADKENLKPFFTHLSELHKKKWQDTPFGSGFDNDKFVNHHQTLIRKYSSSIRIAKLSAGETVLGFQYYLIDTNKVYFYCAGLEMEKIHKHVKPGLMLHIIAMFEFSKLGVREYDFMGGEATYKKRLSNKEYSFYNLRLIKRTPVGIAIRIATLLKQKLSAAFLKL